MPLAQDFLVPGVRTHIVIEPSPVPYVSVKISSKKLYARSLKTDF